MMMMDLFSQDMNIISSISTTRIKGEGRSDKFMEDFSYFLVLKIMEFRARVSLGRLYF